MAHSTAPIPPGKENTSGSLKAGRRASHRQVRARAGVRRRPQEFVDVLKTLHELGLDRTEPVRAGGLGPEAFDAVPFLDLLDSPSEYDSPWGLQELALGPPQAAGAG